MGITLRLLLINHLTETISSLNDYGPEDIVLLVETTDLCTNVKHHKRKLVFQLASQRHFALQLKAKGYKVDYIFLNDDGNQNTLSLTLKHYLNNNKAITKIIVTEPAEYALLQEIKGWSESLKITTEIRDDTQFLCSRKQFSDWACTQKTLVMENFYRKMRQQTGLLLTNGKPIGGKWNYDHNNRAVFKGNKSKLPSPLKFTPDTITQEVCSLVNDRFADHMGNTDGFWFAVTRQQALQALDHFITNSLPEFGEFQDAMVSGQNFLYHSILSPYLNNGLLQVMEVCKAAENAYHSGLAPLNSVEGFIRQLIGWREYIRGVYWYKMPAYLESNFFKANRPLPWFYWDANTKMNCLREVVQQTVDEAYSHHIQRLMITGNFALLAEVDPKQVHEWYLAVYADAYEWVELPNTLGMSQYADGGILGTKPYISSGNYIKKMSDFCSSCVYDVEKKAGPKACPFNYLYWHFLMKHSDKLKKNPRLGYAYLTIEKYNEERKEEIMRDSQHFLNSSF